MKSNKNFHVIDVAIAAQNFTYSASIGSKYQIYSKHSSYVFDLIIQPWIKYR